MKSCQKIITLLLITVLVFPVGYAMSQTIEPDTVIFIQSRFMLWDANEKMLDNNFTINIISFNNSTVKPYEITLNSKIIFGNFTNHAVIYINTSESVLTLLSVRVSNQTLYSYTNIKIVDNISYGQIERIDTPFVISLNPLTWSRQKWNIFFSVIVSGLISIIISYVLVMRYRRLSGVREIR